MLTDLEKNAISEHYRTLAKKLPNFRPRQSQRQMIAQIAKVLSESLTAQEGQDPPVREGESILVVEGPTGVGKSLAYLLAGGILAQSRGKKLIVSSATIALQEQLVEKDLPFLAHYSGLKISFALAKGRGRYLCPYRLYQLAQDTAQMTFTGFDQRHLFQHKISAEDTELLHRLSDAFEKREFNGDKDTWDGPISPVIWSKVTNDRHGCLKNNCPNRSECPFFIARDLLDQVDVVVVNHDLLLSDISMGGGVILPAPADSFYCIDEAHHLSKKALSQFSSSHSLKDVRFFLERMPVIADKIAALADKAELAIQIDENVAALVDCFSDWEMLLNQSDCFPASRTQESVFLWPDGRIPKEFEDLVIHTSAYAATLLKNIYKLEEALNPLRRDKTLDSSLIDKITEEFGPALARAEEVDAVWSKLAYEEKEGEPPLAKWLVLDRKDKPDYYFNASPISSATQLANGLWRRAAGAILTSATLRSLGNFQLLLNQTGLSFFPKTSTEALDSPFSFETQAELYVPLLKNSPKNAEAHTREVAEWLPKLIDTEHPVGTLVLFASRHQMTEVSLRLNDDMAPLVLVQGESSKSQLLQKHQQALDNKKPSIIFGLASFAEGLDLPGICCVHVIIVKLPFAMPDNPIEKTLGDWINKKGGNAFMELSVPETSIKLTQAVGRLIRTEEDYGRVTILDNRVLTASYGKRLLMALPPFKRI